MTVNGEFLHYIYPFQFLDSPEWDSLRPSEEGVFQVNKLCLCSYCKLYNGTNSGIFPRLRYVQITGAGTWRGDERNCICCSRSTATSLRSSRCWCAMTSRRRSSLSTTRLSTSTGSAMISGYQASVTEQSQK